MKDLQIFNQKMISDSVLFSNEWFVYVSNQKEPVKFHPTNQRKDNKAVHGWWKDVDGKTHWTNQQLINIMSAKQFANLEHLTAKKMLKELKIINADLIGQYVAYKYRGTAYNALVTELVTDEKNKIKMKVEFFTSKGHQIRIVDKAKFFTAPALNDMKSVISEKNYKEYVEMNSETFAEVIPEGDPAINIAPAKPVVDKSAENAIKAANKLKEKAEKDAKRQTAKDAIALVKADKEKVNTVTGKAPKLDNAFLPVSNSASPKRYTAPELSA